MQSASHDFHQKTSRMCLKQREIMFFLNKYFPIFLFVSFYKSSRFTAKNLVPIRMTKIVIKNTLIGFVFIKKMPRLYGNESAPPTKVATPSGQVQPRYGPGHGAKEKRTCHNYF